MPTPYYPGITLTPFLGLSLIGMDEVVAQDFILIDAFAEAAGASIEVNGSVVNSPNFTDSATVTFTVVGSNISLTAAGGGGSSGTNIPTEGAVSPTPAYSPSEAPVGVNPAIYVQDANGAWHAQFGMDVTTVTDATGAGGGPTVPQGILVADRIQFVRDTQTPTQSGKNALLSINHEACVGTSYNNQDRAIWIQMGNVTATIVSFSISGNVVTFNLNPVASLFTAGVGFRKGQRIAANGLSVGTYLNGVPLSVQSAGLVTTGTQTITASDSGFTHGDVGTTDDSGLLDQFIYAMEGMQIELDVVGAPQPVAAVDGEFVALSLQFSDNHVGTIGSPNDGVGCIRAQAYREVGAGVWGSIPPTVMNIKHTNFSSVNGQGTALEGIRVSVNDDGGVSNNIVGTAIHLPAPQDRMAGGNIGIDIGNFGSNGADFAIRVAGGQSLFGGVVGVPSLYPTSLSTGGEIQISGSVSAQGLTSEQTTAPAGSSITPIGATGATTYTYVVVARDSNGNPAPGTPTTITNGNATLDGTHWNFVEIQNPSIGPTTFDVYRTVGGATQGKIATVTPSYLSSTQFGTFIIQDKGLVGDSSSVPTVNSTGSFVAAGPVSAGKYTVAGLPSGFEGQMLYATNGLKVGEITGSGTGVPVYFSNAQWRVFSTDAAVAS